MSKLDMNDMNSLNAIAGALRRAGFHRYSSVLLDIQSKATGMLAGHYEDKATLVKTVRVTNPRNALVQIPSFVVANWGLKLDDRLEMLYDESNKQITIRPVVQRGS